MTSDSPNRAIAPTVIAQGVTLRQLDLIQRFEADFNAVDEFLRREMRRPSTHRSRTESDCTSTNWAPVWASSEKVET